MMLGFQDQFVPYVENGSKTHTIRAERRGGRQVRVGDRLDLYARPRQVGMRLLGRFPCVRVERIQITPTYTDYGVKRVTMSIDDVPLTQDEINQLCWRDGFRPARPCDAWIAFAHTWREMHGVKPFSGVLIHWDFSIPIVVTGDKPLRSTTT